jgi:hypothetical protein
VLTAWHEFADDRRARRLPGGEQAARGLRVRRQERLVLPGRAESGLSITE